MGGFHGGHSGGHGGGFHGGHSGGYRSHHTYYGGRHYINGRRYYGAYYGMGRNGKPISFFTSLIFGILLIFFGFMLFFVIATPKSATAVVTKTSKAYDSTGAYEIYDFEYDYNGVTYYGHGDDDLGSGGSYTVNVGEEYTVYLHLYSNSVYEFENETGSGVIALAIFGILGLVLVLNTVGIYSRYKQKLSEIGDVNGDGKLDEQDIEYSENKNNGASLGAYEGAKEAAKENTIKEMKKECRVSCPFCDSVLPEGSTFCPNCGARIAKE
ncbi:MAG: zinc ribbon domain-containing protein [Acholeplasmatales bacterium]|nr:zinc ribbon domain-containing protein [Acholeplasmatales bacterium]